MIISPATPAPITTTAIAAPIPFVAPALERAAAGITPAVVAGTPALADATRGALATAGLPEASPSELALAPDDVARRYRDARAEVREFGKELYQVYHAIRHGYMPM